VSITILAAALHYAARGWPVFPVTAVAKKSHKSEKYSNGRKWGATTDPAEVRQDFSRWPGARIGIVTGAVSSIIVVDVDTLEGHGVDGAIALAELEVRHGKLPETLQAMSPSGSRHFYFRHPGPDIKIKSSDSKLGDGIDIKGDGGCVTAPPSINLDGRRYRWLNPSPIAPMPAWLIGLTTKSRISAPPVSERVGTCIGTIHPGAYGARALEREIDALTNAAPGGRNRALNRASFSLHQLVAGGELNSGEVEGRLIGASAANGLIAADGLPSVMATIESGRRAGLQQPRRRPT
jgi:putative DNA primase/helicase